MGVRLVAIMLSLLASTMINCPVSSQSSVPDNFVEVIPLTTQVLMFGYAKVAIWFTVTQGGRTDMPTIGESKTFWFNEGDFQPDLLKTSERQEILQAFLAKLKAEGWQPAGHGKSWYSYRF